MRWCLSLFLIAAALAVVCPRSAGAQPISVTALRGLDFNAGGSTIITSQASRVEMPAGAPSSAVFQVEVPVDKNRDQHLSIDVTFPSTPFAESWQVAYARPGQAADQATAVAPRFEVTVSCDAGGDTYPIRVFVGAIFSGVQDQPAGTFGGDAPITVEVTSTHEKSSSCN